VKTDEQLRRQLGFELLSVFKGATTEAIDDAVSRILWVLAPRKECPICKAEQRL
jgi:hypothetical protein